LVGVVLAEQQNDWIQQNRYMSLTSLEHSKAVITANIASSDVLVPVFRGAGTQEFRVVGSRFQPC